MEWLYIICILIDQGKNVLGSIKGLKNKPALNEMVQWLSSNSAAVDTIINSFETKNYNAINALVNQNPVLSKGSMELRKAGEVMNQLKIKKAELEAKLNTQINDYENMVNDNNIITNIHDAITGKTRKKKQQIEELQNQYDSVVDNIKAVDKQVKRGTNYNPFTMGKNDGAVQQNIKGGIKDA